MCILYTWQPTLAIDEGLIEAASKRATPKRKRSGDGGAGRVHPGRRQLRILDSFGTVTFDPAL